MRYALYIFVVAVFIASCSSEAPAPARNIEVAGGGAGVIVDAPEGATVATVNGETLTAPMLDVFAKGRGLDPGDPSQREQALEALVENVLLAQDARARGLVARPEVQAELALVRLQQLAGRNLSEYRGTLQIGEDEVRAYYDAEVARTGGVEVQLKHILFADEASASAANERALKPEADFDALILEYAAAGAKQARELGWANFTQLPPELAAAVQPLPDGQVAPLPVQTAYGWHVVKRIASRPYAPPPFEQVREGARKQLIDRALADQVKALREKARIEIAPANGGGAPSPVPPA